MLDLTTILQLRSQGHSQEAIASKLGVSRWKIRTALMGEADNSSLRTAAIFNDMHRPFHDTRAEELVLQIIHRAQPDLIVANGDIQDMWAISKYFKAPALRRYADLPAELESGAAFWAKLRRLFPDTRIKYIFGNHEFRWDKYIVAQAKELYGLTGMTLTEQLGLKELDIDVVYTGLAESSWKWGDLLIGHFDVCRKYSGYTAKAIAEDLGVKILQGHTHRGGAYFKRMYDRTIMGYENFCTCKLNPEYFENPNWQQGMSLAYKNDREEVTVEQIPFYMKPSGTGRWAQFRGQLIEA